MAPALITYSLFTTGPLPGYTSFTWPRRPMAKYTLLIHHHHLLVRQNMIHLDGQRMEKHLRMCVSFNIIGGPVQFLNDGLLLADIGYLIQSQGYILFAFGYGEVVSADEPEPDRLLQKVVEIPKELLLALPPGFADLVNPFHLGNGAILQDGVQPF